MIQKVKLKLIVVVIKEMKKIKKSRKKNEQMVFATILRRFIHIDKETLEDMKYQSEIYVSIIEFSYVDKTPSSGLYKERFQC